ncbi:MAG: hypothetical protein V1754_01810, partial [Pseudomonadota bacterium]
AIALKYDTDPATEWRNWSGGWRFRWRALNRRCRLNQLAGAGVSEEIDKMYEIHSSLAELQLSYTDVMDRFVEQYVERLQKLRLELKEVRSMIDRRNTLKPPKGKIL